MAVPRFVTRWLLRLVGLGLIVLATIVLLFAFQARLRLPALRAWHRVHLAGEFKTGAGAPASFEEYRRLEDRLFGEVRQRILDDPKAADTNLLSRYNPKSRVEQLALDTPYNRSFELEQKEPKGAVLLVHGLSDSPYSMRTIADIFHAQGYYVLALRLPGHGTIPSGLIDVSWKDWYAAVVLAAKYAATRAGPGNPLFVGGHSTGGALTTLYSVRSLQDSSLPRPQRLYLVSPAIGISPFAVLTNIVAGLSFLPAFEKSKWIDVMPEYDPYKYNSFPVNAGNQIDSLTRVLRREMLAASKAGRLDGMPRVTVFQSLIDSTVSAADVKNNLMNLLPPHGHELVVFDVNQREELEGLINPGPIAALDRLRHEPNLPFRLTVIGNRDGGTERIAEFTREAGASAETENDLPLEWPRGVFSLGHVALPFPPDDPVYGLDPKPGPGPEYKLGMVALRGESGALLVPLGTFARLRCNPFFDVVRAHILATLAAGSPAPEDRP